MAVPGSAPLPRCTPATMAGSLRRRLGSVRFLVTASGIAFILVVNALIGYGLLQSRREAIVAGERATRDLARMLEAQALRTAFATDQLLSDLSFVLDTHAEAASRGSPAMHDYLKRRLAAFPELAGLAVIGADGRVLHHSAATPPPLSPLTDRAYFARQREPGSGLFIGALIDSRVVPDTQVIPFSRRRSGPEGDFRGVVVAMANPARLAATLESQGIDRKGGMFLALDDGTVLLERPQGRPGIGSLSGWPAAQAMLDASAGQRRRDGLAEGLTARGVAPGPAGAHGGNHGGIDSLISVRRVPGYPFVVVTTLPVAAVLADWRRDSAAWTAIAIVMTLAIALLTAFVVRQHMRREEDRARLARVSRRIRGILDSMLDAVVTFDTGGRIITFNRAAETMFGVAEREMVGQPIEALIPGARDSGAESDLTARRRDGHAVPVAFTVSDLRLGGWGQGSGQESGPEEPRVFVGVIRDMTRRKQQEAELVASKTQAELANRAKSEFLANMSHELRTPLNAIIGFAEVLDSGYFGAANERQKSCISDIHESGRHLLDIVNAVLDMSKLEAGQFDLAEEAIEAHEAVAQCLMMVRDRAASGGIAIDNEVAAAVATLWVDRRAFKQVVLNLLSNAVKFTPAGGRVTITAGREADGGFRLAVADTGIGIPADFMPHLFQPFRQAENAANRRYEGTGLGLSISKNFIDLHGGSLTCDSRPGEGTCMTVRLPAERVLDQPIAAAAAGIGKPPGGPSV
ncbi:ATP-binding protein [Azospirillum picis]|nr:ATP-binding protein [Azospirillum picis]